jgi:hypothetical protein
MGGVRRMPREELSAEIEEKSLSTDFADDTD